MRPTLYAARNIVKACLFLGGFAAALTALGWWLGGFRVASLFFVVGLLMAATVYWYGPRIILASLGARELLLAEAPQLHATVERLAVAAGVERPKLYLMADGHPRALSVGRGTSASGIAVSQGLLAVTEPLYIVDPFSSGGLAALFSTHPPVGERVQRLRALDPDWRERLRAA